MSRIYTAAVIGLGRIGSSYPSEENPRTHAEVYLKSKRINLIAGVDPDNNARKNFLKKWRKNIPVFENVEAMLRILQPDIVSVCVPTCSLINTVKHFLKNPPRLFFLEKPVIENYNNSKVLIKAIDKIPTAVNYHRCWDPSHNSFFNQAKKSSKIMTIKVIYNGGMFNAASHIIALLIKNFGKVSNFTTLKTQGHNVKNKDPSFSFIINFDCGIQGIFQGFDEIKYNLLELEMITSSGIYSLKSGGCRKRIEKPKKNAYYTNYYQLVDSYNSLKDGQVQGLSQAIKNIINFLDGKDKKLLCDLDLSLNVSKIMSKIYKQYKNL